MPCKCVRDPLMSKYKKVVSVALLLNLICILSTFLESRGINTVLLLHGMFLFSK